MDGVAVGGKLEGEKEDVGTTTSAGSEAPRSGTRVEEGGRAVGVEVGGPVAEPVRAEAEEGDVVGVAVIGAPVVDVVGGLVLVEEEEEEVEVGEEEEGVVQVEEGEDGVERSVDVLGASSESDALKQKTPNFVSGGAPHVTTPVLPFPQLLLDVSRGTTAVCLAVQPYLQVSSPRCSARSICSSVATVAFNAWQAAAVALKL